MNVLNYFLEIRKEITRLNSYINRNKEKDYCSNPFLEILPHTYVWIENQKDDTNKED